jgi:hypothetical protein
MNIKAGDKVRFLDAAGGGTVTRVEGRLAFVEDEDGFEIPVLITGLVIVETESTVISEKQQEPKEQEVVEEDETYEYVEEDDGDEDPMVNLAFLQGDKPGVQSGSVRYELINDSNYFCYYLINEIGMNEQAVNLYNGKLEPNTKLYLGKQLVTELDGQAWNVQVLMFKTGKLFEPLPVIDKVIKLKGSKLMNENSYVENDYFDEKALLFHVLKGKLQRKIEELTVDDLNSVKKQKETKPVKKKAKRRDEPGILEVDLHIHELIDNTNGLSNSEMLSIQMDKFHQVMKENIKNKKRKIVFIHGVGNGTLKTELRKALDRKYKGHYYQDASFREYGYGATMVII